MGDDIPDISPIMKVGLKTCPFDAVSQVRDVVDYVSPVNGGQGCVRDIIEQTLKVQENWKLKNANQNI